MNRFVAVVCFALVGLAASADEPSALVLRRNDVIAITVAPTPTALGQLILPGGPGRLNAPSHEMRYAIEGLRLVGNRLSATRLTVTIHIPNVIGEVNAFGGWRTVIRNVGSANLVATATIPPLSLPTTEIAFELSRDAGTNATRLRFTEPRNLTEALQRSINDAFTDTVLNAVEFRAEGGNEALRDFLNGLIGGLRAEPRRRQLNEQIRAALRTALTNDAALASLATALSTTLPSLSLGDRRVPGRLALTEGATAYSTIRLGTFTRDVAPTAGERAESLVVAMNEEAMRIAVPAVWPSLQAFPANDQERNDFSRILSILHDAPVPAAGIHRVSFAPRDGQHAVTFLAEGRLRLQADLLVGAAPAAPNAPPPAPLRIPVTVTATVRDGALTVDAIEGSQGAPERVGAYERLRGGFQTGLLRLAMNTNLATAQRDRRLSVEILRESNDSGPYLEVRLR